MKNLLIFCLGASIGAVGAYFVVKKKYDEMLRNEVESVKEVYRAKAEAAESDSNDISENEIRPSMAEKPEMMDYYNTIRNEKYIEPEEEKDNSDQNIPEAMYVIAPDSYGELDYDTISFNYWADGVLTDEDDNVVDDYEDIIGGKALNSFGEYEEDSVYVRNDVLRVDYEILKDIRKFSDYKAKSV